MAVGLLQNLEMDDINNMTALHCAGEVSQAHGLEAGVRVRQISRE